MKIKTLLVYPPQAIPYQPYPSLPSLAAFLRSQGYEVEQRDVNIEAYLALLTPSRLHLALERIERKLDELRQKGCQSKEEQVQVEALLKAKVPAPYIIDHIGEAIEVMHDPVQFYDLERCSWAHKILRRGLELLSAEYYPTLWTPNALHTQSLSSWRQSVPTFQTIMQDVRNESENVFLPFLRDEALPSILRASPNLVGLSVTYLSQIVPALTLADLIKRADPSIHICVGGARVVCDPLWTRPATFSLIDSVVAGEGEHALLALIQKLERGDEDLSDVPNLLWQRDGVVHHSTATCLEDMNELPTPEWSGLPLGSYLAPAFVPMLPTARGCYWNKCAFCTVSRATRKKYRPRRIDLVLEDMQALYERHDARHFFLSCDSESPQRMEELAAGLKEKHLPFTWQCETRISPQLTPDACQRLFEGGCRYFLFGLESACQRVLDWMQKGIRASDFPDVMRNCYQAGIGMHLMAFLGFPSETKEEAQATVDFMIGYREYIEGISLAAFILEPSSRVDLDPARYGVTHIHRNADADIAQGYDYEVSQGMTQSEAHEQRLEHFRRLVAHYSSPAAIMPVLNAFLYVAHYGLHKLEELKSAWRARTEDLPDMKPRMASQLLRRDFRANGEQSERTVLFNQATGDLLVVDAQAAHLLDMCDGERSADDIATVAAEEAGTSREFITGYFQTLGHIKRLCENRMLENAP